MILDRIRFLAKSGKGYLTLYLLLAISVGMLIIDTAFDITSDRRALQIVGVLCLMILSELLYLRLKEKSDHNDSISPENAGITGCLSHLTGQWFEDIMSSPGEKHILNTWIFNFQTLAPLLETALHYEKTKIDITLLKADSEYAISRSEELRRDVESAINTNLDDLAFFLNRLPDNMRTRVRIYEFNETPKFSLHASDETCIVGFYWPNQYAAHGPQLVIEGRARVFTKHILEYYRKLKRIEITESVINRVASTQTTDLEQPAT